MEAFECAFKYLTFKCEFNAFAFVNKPAVHTSLVSLPSIHSVGLVVSHHKPEVVSEV